MKLIDIFLELDLPSASNRNLFNASTLDDYSFAKVAINGDGFPVILISSLIDGTHLSKKNIRLKYLELTHNLECKISENSKVKFAEFSVIIFKSNQSYLQKYFLGIAETLIKSLSLNPTQKEVYNSFNSLVEIFRSLSETPTKTVQGLWSELLVIEMSNNPETLLNYWHCKPYEKFDFNADNEKLEVKSNSNLERIHIFSSEQLNPTGNNQIVIASLFTKQKVSGISIEDLLLSIKEKTTENELVEKLFLIVSKTLGNTIEQSIKIKFDYDLAKNSVEFYKHQDISKIEKINIPYKVSEVRYKSNLTDIKPIVPQELKIGGQLFDAL
ncbi:MAG: PD-(D/E)XK motif protein [Bacteroidetes bacterium]|nr:PD-(D/E)XK motif protein [Bacteroidota bacterium]